MEPAEVRLVAFDLDGTLSESKSSISQDMAWALARLMGLRQVAIISGGRFQQFDNQVLSLLPAGAPLGNLHLLPTCGSRYLKHDGDGWAEIYIRELTVDERGRATASLIRRAKELGYWEPDAVVAGERIEDRGSQITYSALGQLATPADKRAWDPSGVKRHTLRDAVAADVPDLAVAAGGATSIDITRRGVDKAYGLMQLSQQTDVPLTAMLFIGDRTEPGGNDYPVVQLGVATIPVADWDETLSVITRLCERIEEK